MESSLKLPIIYQVPVEPEPQKTHLLSDKIKNNSMELLIHRSSHLRAFEKPITLLTQENKLPLPIETLKHLRGFQMSQ